MHSSWNRESRPSWPDYFQVLLFSLTWPLLRLSLDRTIFQFLSSLAVTHRSYNGVHPNLDPAGAKKVLKFKESLWKLLYYVTLESYIIAITYSEPWATNTATFWDNWPLQTLKFKLKVYYTAQCGFYIYSVLALLFWETRRKDFVVMMTHHVVTIGLVAYSYITGNFRVGSVVLALHDVSDIFMEAAKLFKYAEQEAMASLFFAFFALSWLLLRLIYFPFWIIWSTSVESLRYIDTSDPWVPWEYYQFNTLLIVLLVMHLYWWLLICRMIARQMANFGKVGEDVRSDSEED